MIDIGGGGGGGKSGGGGGGGGMKGGNIFSVHCIIQKNSNLAEE